MNDDFDDLTILQAASHIWHTPVKQKLLQDLSALSPSKRQPALKAKIFNLQNPEESPDEEEQEEEEQEEEEQEEEEQEQEEQEEGERQ
jgi:cobalamin biosynthesis protein CobT